MSRLKSFLACPPWWVYLLSLLVYLSSPLPIHAAPTVWTGDCISQGDVATIKGLECLTTNILQVVVYFAGLVFFIMFIVGGFKYLFSQNDPKAVAAATTTLTHALFGLVGIIVSWLILNFIGQFTGVNVTNFSLPSP